MRKQNDTPSAAAFLMILGIMVVLALLLFLEQLCIRPRFDPIALEEAPYADLCMIRENLPFFDGFLFNTDGILVEKQNLLICKVYVLSVKRHNRLYALRIIAARLPEEPIGKKLDCTILVKSYSKNVFFLHEAKAKE